MSPDTTLPRNRPQIERQRRLPFSTAVEISLKGIKVRFWRSILTVSSIILAIAFLMWQFTSAEIIRHLTDVSQDPANPVDRDAARLKIEADRCDTEAKTYAAAHQGTLDAYDTADKRLAAGVALAAVRTCETRLTKVAADLAAAEADLLAPQLEQTRKEYQRLEADLENLRLRLQATDPALPQYADLGRRIEDLKRQLKERGKAYDEFQIKRSTRDVALSQKTDAEMRLAAAQTAAAATKVNFPDAVRAPDGSAELDRLVAARDAARREKERVEKRSAALNDRAAAAKQRFENAQRSALLRLLETHGDQGASREGEKGPIEIALPLGLRLTPTRLWITVLALLVCLVGITNAMLMSVTERYREIGTMKCLGALDSFIVKIFLLESSIQGIIGVVVGIVLGFLLAVPVQMNNFGAFVMRYFPGAGLLKWAGVAFLVGAILSVLGGILPAQRAARMQPVDAMRIEE